jgi:hypothetical protein
VQEYFIFDPLQEFPAVSLQGFRLTDGQYTPIVAESDGSLTVQEIGCRIWREGSLLRMSDPLTGEPILWEHEIIAKLQAAQDRAEQEAQRAEQEAQRAAIAEAENIRLHALLQRIQDGESNESVG